MARISLFNSKELQAAVLALSSFDRTMRTNVRRVTRILGNAEWQPLVRRHASTNLERVVLANTARVTASDQTVMLQAGRIGRTMRGGARPPEVFGGTEFGAFSNVKEVQMTSARGRRYTARRDVNRQFRPRNRRGYVVWPAAGEFIPRQAAMWAQTIVRTFHEAMEGKR